MESGMSTSTRTAPPEARSNAGVGDINDTRLPFPRTPNMKIASWNVHW